MASTSALFVNEMVTGELAFPGLFNPQGLQKFRCAYRARSGVGCGGVDVVFIGDSIMHGSASGSNIYSDSPMHKFKIAIQTLLNPSGVTGGFGFFPASDGTVGSYGSGSGTPLTLSMGSTAASYLVYTEDNGTSTNGSIQGAGTGARSVLIDNNGDADTQKYIFFAMDNSATTIPYMRDKFSAFQIIYSTETTFGTITYDTATGSGATPGRGVGTVTGTIATNTASSTGNRSSVLSVSNTYADARICLRPDASSTTQVCIDGIVLYNGDERCGVRVHMCTKPGTRFYDWSPKTVSASITKFCTGGYEGAINGGLFVACEIINSVEALYGGTLTLSQIKVAWTAIMEAVKGCATGASILVVIPPKPTAYLTGAKLEQWDQLKGLWKDLVTQYKDFASMLDLTQYSQLTDADNADAKHGTIGQYSDIAQVLINVIYEVVK